MDKYSIFNNYINDASKIVVFSGAGMSTESGIKDFRSKDGLYNEEYDYPPEKILSHSFFINHTDEFYKFYRNKLNCLGYKPNFGHLFFANLEKSGKDVTIVTQNIDNLHSLAGSKNVIELHGNVNRNYCSSCGKFYDAFYVFNSDTGFRCSCGGVIKPDVVLYDEALDEMDIFKAIKAISEADLLIILGTSLSVYPASGFVSYFNGDHVVIINNDSTYMDGKADLVFNEKIGDVLRRL